MRRRQSTLPRLLLAALVTLSGSGSRPAYVHSHSAHHAHSDHDAGARDDHDHPGELPGLSEGFAHVHASWLGIPITFPVPEGRASTASGLDSDPCPNLVTELNARPPAPWKERIPWGSSLSPPDLHHPILAGHLPDNLLRDGAGTSYVLYGRTVVLRC